jgi:hypothetical protein
VSLREPPQPQTEAYVQDEPTRTPLCDEPGTASSAAKGKRKVTLRLPNGTGSTSTINVDLRNENSECWIAGSFRDVPLATTVTISHAAQHSDSIPTPTAGTSRSSWGAHKASGRKRSAMEDGLAWPPRRKQKFQSRNVVASDEEDDIEARLCTGLSLQTKGKAVARPNGEVSEASKASRPLRHILVLTLFQVCDACRTRGLPCAWPTSTESSVSRNEKRACTMCSSHKIRCTIAGQLIPSF